MVLSEGQTGGKSRHCCQEEEEEEEDEPSETLPHKYQIGPHCTASICVLAANVERQNKTLNEIE